MTVNTLTTEQRSNLAERGFSRRNFGRVAAMLSAGASLPFFNEAAMAQLSQIKGPVPADAVMINSNENPLGPCPAAIEAATAMVKNGGRYLFGITGDFRDLLAEQEGLKANYVQQYPGSSAPLHQTVLAFTSPTKSLVMSDPGYESGAQAANLFGAKVHRVPLMADKGYKHDVKAMVAADPNAGLFYICNPNNPTGTLTPREDIEWLLANKPKGSILLLDEAYTHISGAAMCSDLVAADKDIVILRTFSKIYGMAGLRAGAVFARPDLMSQIRKWSAGEGMMPITAIAAASASLKDKNLIPDRRAKIGKVRNDVQAFFDKHNVKYVPSTSNCIMVDCKTDPQKVITAFAAEKIYVGRTWKVWPTYYRITIGTQDEMDKYKAAFLKVMA